MASDAPRLRDEDLPALFKAADAASRDGQRWFVEAVRGSLVLSVAAAFFGIPTLAEDAAWPSVAAAAAFGLGALLSLYLYWGRPERRWYDGRAAAESLKTLAWQFAVGGGEYAKGADARAEPGIEEAFVRRLADVLTELRNVDVRPAAGEQITAGMRAVRGASLAGRRRVYRDDRIGDQQAWYTGRATLNRSRARRWLAAAIGVQLVGTAVAALHAAGVIEVDLLGLIAAAAAAAAAWLQVKDHGMLAEAYAVAAQELALIRAQIDRVEDEEAWRGFVERAEQAISREHVLWRARRGHAM
jgi:conflict system pore-forming effector with SLATT domain